MTDIIARLRSSEPLPACPYDKLSPHYLTAPIDKPCMFCGGLNEPDAPDLCRGADTRIMGEAADEIERLLAQCNEIEGRRRHLEDVSCRQQNEIGRLNTRVTNLTYALERVKHGAEYCDELGGIIDSALGENR